MCAHVIPNPKLIIHTTDPSGVQRSLLSPSSSLVSLHLLLPHIPPLIFSYTLQTHLERDVPFSVFLPGILAAASDAKAKLGLDVALVMCFLRHLSEESALQTLEQVGEGDWEGRLQGEEGEGREEAFGSCPGHVFHAVPGRGEHAAVT